MRVDKFHDFVLCRAVNNLEKICLVLKMQKPLLLTAFVLISMLGKVNGFVYYLIYKGTKGHI